VYKSQVPTGENLEDARRFMVRCWQGLGQRSRVTTGWRRQFDTNSSALDTWLDVGERIRAITKPLRRAQIENRDAFKLIEELRRPDCVLYVDPPYMFGTRCKSNRYYTHEMSDADHERLLGLLLEHPGPVLLSGYATELYDRMLAGWQRVERQTMAQGSQGVSVARTEVLWLSRCNVPAGLFDSFEISDVQAE